MKHACLAYFPKSLEERSQTIEEHINRGLEFLENVYLGKRFVDYIHRLASYLGFKVSYQECRNALYASYIFHDLGKTSKMYQEARANFSGHEIISAYWVIEHGDQLSLGEMLYPVSLSIYLHHHDIRRDKFKKIENVDLCSECLETLLATYREKTSINLRVNKIKTRFKEEIHVKLIKSLFNTFGRRDDKLNYFRLSYPFLQVVHGADNYSALEREGRRSVLSIEIIKVLNAIQSLREKFVNISR